MNDINKNTMMDEESILNIRDIKRNSFTGNLRTVRNQSENVALHLNYSPQEVRRIRKRLLRTYYHPIRASGFCTRFFYHFTRNQQLVFISLALVDFVSFCSMSIMAPFFPVESAAKGMSNAVSGLVFSFYAFIMFISSPIFGKILPIVGAKFMFMCGMFVSGGCSIIFGLLDKIENYTTFAVYCFLIRGTEALGAAAYATATYTFLADIFPDDIGPAMGFLETFVGLGMITGPLIGGVLYSFGGFGLPFFALGLLMVLFVPINLFLLPSSGDGAIRPRSGSILAVLKVPSVIVIGLVVVAAANNLGFLDPTLEPHLRYQFDSNTKEVVLAFLLLSVIYGISSPIWGLLAQRSKSHWSMMFFGLLLSSIGLFLLGPAPYIPFLKSSIWLTAVALAILAVGTALSIIPTLEAVLNAVYASEGCINDLSTRSVVAGVWSGMYSLGEVIGPSVGGLLLEWYGFQVCSTVMATLSLTLSIVIFIFFICNGQAINKKNTTNNFEDSENNSSDSSNSPLLSDRLTHYASNYGTLDDSYTNSYEGADTHRTSDVLKTVAVTATGAIEV